jgi:hypothetical protein
VLRALPVRLGEACAGEMSDMALCVLNNSEASKSKVVMIYYENQLVNKFNESAASQLSSFKIAEIWCVRE